MYCKVERKQVPSSELETDSLWGTVHKGARSYWHTIGGTELYGQPDGGQPGATPPMYPALPAEASGVPLYPPAPPPEG
jgi:hypothetical protein